MHLYLATRGIKQDVDRFISELSAKYLPHTYKDNSGADVNGFVQVAVRPVQLWEIVFPEQHLNTMLGTLWPNRAATDGHYGNVATMKFKWLLDKARKLLGVDELPKDFAPTDMLLLYKSNIEFIGLGTKKDVKIDGIEML